MLLGPEYHRYELHCDGIGLLRLAPNERVLLRNEGANRSPRTHELHLNASNKAGIESFVAFG